MKNILFILLTAFPVAFGNCLSAQNTLSEYLETAAENNPGLKAKFSEYKASLQVIPQVKALPDPQISFGYFIIPIETKTGPQQFKISGSQIFPWFGNLKAKENAAIQIAKAKYEIFEQAESELFLDVRNAYYTLYYLKNSIKATDENIRILETYKKLATVKVEVGKTSAVDVLRIEMEIAELKNKLKLSEESFYSEQVRFNKLLNADKESPITISDIDENLFIPDKQTVLDSIKMNNHDLKSSVYQIKASDYLKIVARKEGMPRFSAGFDYTFIGTGENNLSGTDAFLAPKIGVSIPINRRKYKARISESEFKSNATLMEKENTENLLEINTETVFRDYDDAERRVELYANQLYTAKKALRILENEYTVNSVGFEELLRMERKILNFELALIKARSDKEKAIAKMYFLTGK